MMDGNREEGRETSLVFQLQPNALRGAAIVPEMRWTGRGIAGTTLRHNFASTPHEKRTTKYFSDKDLVNRRKLAHEDQSPAEQHQ